jgi:hypothetical protein
MKIAASIGVPLVALMTLAPAHASAGGAVAVDINIRIHNP